MECHEMKIDPKAQKELLKRQEKQKEKTARRLEAKTRKANEPSGGSGGEDPDIAGIVPGPQASPWGDEMDIEVEADADEVV